MKYFDITIAALLVIGGLNWGLVGFFGFDFFAYIFGPMAFVTRLLYALIGVAAIYEAVSWRAIMRRWHCDVPGPLPVHSSH